MRFEDASVSEIEALIPSLRESAEEPFGSNQRLLAAAYLDLLVAERESTDRVRRPAGSENP